MKYLDLVLRHNVEYKGSMLCLPILMLQCSKVSQQEKEAHRRGLKFSFLEGIGDDEMFLKTPPLSRLPTCHPPGLLGIQACQNPGFEGEKLPRFSETQRENSDATLSLSDTLTQ